jgi:hypothetical protein
VKPVETRDLRKEGHVEQIRASRCFQGSRGELSCLSCHDPHAPPTAQEKASYYRSRCLHCHQDRGCSLPVAERKAKNKDDSCSACHMARGSDVKIVHTAITDHRLTRHSAAEMLVTPGPEKPSPPHTNPLVAFFEKPPGTDDVEQGRDLGIGLMHWDMRGESPARIAASALPGLEAAFRKHPGDLDAGDALARAYALLGRHADALATHQNVLERSPNREGTLGNAGTAAAHAKRLDEAIAYLTRARDLNPWFWEYHFRLASLLAIRGDWAAARAECKLALGLNPADVETRRLLVRCLLQEGDSERARAESEILAAFAPR